MTLLVRIIDTAGGRAARGPAGNEIQVNRFILKEAFMHVSVANPLFSKGESSVTGMILGRFAECCRDLALNVEILCGLLWSG